MDRVLLYAQRLYYRRDQLDCPPLNGLNHYLSLNKTGAHITGERFRVTGPLVFLIRLKCFLLISNVVSFENVVCLMHLPHIFTCTPDYFNHKSKQNKP